MLAGINHSNKAVRYASIAGTVLGATLITAAVAEIASRILFSIGEKFHSKFAAYPAYYLGFACHGWTETGRTELSKKYDHCLTPTEASNTNTQESKEAGSI